MPDTLLQWMEFLSYIVTVFGLPLAIYVFVVEQRKERESDEEEIYQRLSDEYASFLKLCIENADLALLSEKVADLPVTVEQAERKKAIFGILIALFERAYILEFEEGMGRQRQRRWQSWEDYMRDWCTRRDFREALPRLLDGEDPDFARHIHRLSQGNAEK
ncbi:MAG: hypothetical protein HYY48_07255 [Gammaproteobacteria bacterium]|nr:hypothetical protein [Gammaproteobacteria bacterium]